MKWLPLVLCAACGPAPIATLPPPAPPPKKSQAELMAERRAAACRGPEEEPPAAVLIDTPVLAEGFVGAVRIEGNARVTDEEILATVGTSPGVAVDPGQVAADVHALWTTGDFEDIAVTTLGSTDDVTVVFEVRELPLIGAVFGDEPFNTPLRTFDRHKVDLFRQGLRQRLLADGHRRAKVEIRRRRPEPGVVDLCVVVDKGPRAVVAAVVFEGNIAFSDAELGALYSSLIGAPLPDVDLTAHLTARYYDNGYIKVRVDKPRTTLSDDGTAFTIAFVIEEGPQFKVGSVSVKGALTNPPTLSTQTGAIFSRTQARADVAAIQQAAGSGAVVTPLTTVDDAKKTVDVVFDVQVPAAK